MEKREERGERGSRGGVCCFEGLALKIPMSGLQRHDECWVFSVKYGKLMDPNSVL